MSQVIQITSEEQFAELLADHSRIIFLKFWAPWCGPCRNFAVRYENVAAKHESAVFAEVNIEEVPLDKKYNVRGIPTVMAFRGGELGGIKIGALTESAFNAWVEECTKS